MNSEQILAKARELSHKHGIKLEEALLVLQIESLTRTPQEFDVEAIVEKVRAALKG